MKFTAKRSDLTNALSLITKVSQKSTMDVLSKVMFEAFDNTLRLSATNLAVEQKLSFSAAVKEKGGFAVDAKNIHGLIRNMYSENVDFVLDEEKYWVKFNCGKVKAKLAASSTDEFPQFSSLDDVETFSMAAEKLKLLMGMGGLCISHDEGRPHLNGMLVEMGGDKLVGAGTDGHRLSLYSLPFPGAPKEKYLIPEKGLTVLRSLVGARGEDVLFGRHGNKIFVQRDIFLGAEEEKMQTSLVIREPDARFPPYEKVIPKDFEKKCVVNRKDFQESIKRALFISRAGEQNYISLQFSGGDSLKISGEDLTIGGIDDVIPVEIDNPDEFTIGFNGVYLLDVVNALSDSTELLLFFNDSFDACKVTASDEIENFTGIIMPVRI